jgi:hypothetical protein
MNAKLEAPASLDAIAQQLRAEETRVVTEHAELETRRRELSRELRRVRSALSALGAKADTQRGRGNTRSSAMSTADVIESILQVLSSGDALPTDELRVLVQDRAKSAGRSLIGLHLRFAGALRDERLQVRDGVCRRATATSLFGEIPTNATPNADAAITQLPGIGPSSKGSKGGSS